MEQMTELMRLGGRLLGNYTYIDKQLNRDKFKAIPWVNGDDDGSGDRKLNGEKRLKGHLVKLKVINH